jgi:hypothetical protein
MSVTENVNKQIRVSLISHYFLFLLLSLALSSLDVVDVLMLYLYIDEETTLTIFSKTLI